MPNNYIEEVNGVLVIKQEHLQRLNELREQVKKTKEEYDKLSKGIVEEIKRDYTSESMTISNYNFIKKGGTYSYELDVDSLRLLYPSVYDECLKPVVSKITYQLAIATREKKGKE